MAAVQVSKKSGRKRSEEPAMEWFWAALDSHLAQKQLKQTKQRRAIVSFFLDLASHVSAEELHDYIRAQGHSFGLATIYRTLNLLKEAGLAEQKNFEDGKAVFEVSIPHEHHDHIVCIKCAKVVEFVDPEIEKLQEQVAASLGFRLQSHRLDMFGVCMDCRSKEN